MLTWELSENDAYIGSKFSMPKTHYDKLYQHQKEGISWLTNIFFSDHLVKGALLNDDMGLGKTIQTICFLKGLFKGKAIKNALIVAPVSVFDSWMRELNHWAGNINCLILSSKLPLHEFNKALRLFKEGGMVLVTNYQLIQSRSDKFSDAFSTDVLVLDEGHCLKGRNTKTTKSVRSINAKFRLLLSGTVIQNNIDELWSLFDVIGQGKIIGSYSNFSSRFKKQLKNVTFIYCVSQIDENSAENQVAMSSLKKMIDPYILSRSKSILNVLKAKKFEYVVWLQLLANQEEVYKRIVKGVVLEEMKKQPFIYINQLRRACSIAHLGQFQASVLRENLNTESLSKVLASSTKLKFLDEFIPFLHETKFKCLFFARNLLTLDYIEMIIKSKDKDLNSLRLDGDTDNSERQKLVNEFNENENIFAFLCTIQCGSVGLTLTVDPEWNPAIDEQAVDRAYRIKQTKDVVTFRFITCNTVEESLYYKQTVKSSMKKSFFEGNLHKS
ncbi:Helicase, superfamily 1/2, ATP-binding domain-containing protein [Rozella allomycis CSF55]|uniref:Helicase, superfamily 1/2, ATP-binding domain-containing protein n=1 Tax=Rozella allomycis (strain CSF55) TaxID=988480 RepID=A0A075B2N9_ROZAC|nr:Helicase, superfamily 1/2, ATP-binding domain-containing protein [Rozella allomycis CSF55]|eukprot:EPZ35226.1 Helicase, superfamily 1/2, ATP-binding domain-containing protein [Rozella allomycis CSF55]